MKREMVVELLDPLQARLLKEWSPERKMEATRQICRYVARTQLAMIRSQFPAWTEEEVRREAARRRGMGGRI